MKFKTTFIIAAAMLMAACTGNTNLTSPDGEINVSFSLNQDGVPHYQVSAYGQAVINDSGLGLEAEQAELDKGFAITKTKLTIFE